MGRQASLCAYAAAAFALLVACGSSGESAPQSQVLAANSCPDSRCVGVEAAVDQLGWIFLEPNSVPEEFELYSREIVADGGAPGSAPTGSGNSIRHSFRFQGSVNVAPISITQTRPSEDLIELTPQSAECGEMAVFAGGEYFYAEGLVRLLPTPDPSIWVVCPDETTSAPHTHSVIVNAGGNVLIEVLAFPESGVSGEEIIALVESLTPVSGNVD